MGRAMKACGRARARGRGWAFSKAEQCRGPQQCPKGAPRQCIWARVASRDVPAATASTPRPTPLRRAAQRHAVLRCTYPLCLLPPLLLLRAAHFLGGGHVVVLAHGPAKSAQQILFGGGAGRRRGREQRGEKKGRRRTAVWHTRKGQNLWTCAPAWQPASTPAKAGQAGWTHAGSPAAARCYTLPRPPKTFPLACHRGSTGAPSALRR